jgi:hypothetical protein
MQQDPKYSFHDKTVKGQSCPVQMPGYTIFYISERSATSFQTEISPIKYAHGCTNHSRRIRSGFELSHTT